MNYIPKLMGALQKASTRNVTLVYMFLLFSKSKSKQIQNMLLKHPCKLSIKPSIKPNIKILVTIIGLLLSTHNIAQVKDKIELETTIIKGNTELPKILYVVPWQDEINTKVGEQRLVLHSLFGDILKPTASKEATLGLTEKEP